MRSLSQLLLLASALAFVSSPATRAEDTPPVAPADNAPPAATGPADSSVRASAPDTKSADAATPKPKKKRRYKKKKKKTDGLKGGSGTAEGGNSPGLSGQ